MAFYGILCARTVSHLLDNLVMDNKDQIIAREDFESLLDQSFSLKTSVEGKIVQGRVVGIENGSVIIDVGLKSDGRIPMKEFQAGEESLDIKPGDMIDVFIERYEDREGDVMLSYEKARQETTWTHLMKSFSEGTPVEGAIVSKIKGGFIVDLQGAMAFLPGSQIDIRPIKDRDVSSLMNVPLSFIVIKMEQSRNNIVVSRRAVMEKSRSGDRKDILSRIKQGDRIVGTVKNITDYGAFIDLGGIDGLLHVTDVAWKRVDINEVFHVGKSVEVMVIRFNKETERISLGMKQLENDPWGEIEKKYSIGQKVHGVITNITDVGAFVEIEEGIEGLIYVSEMVWNRKNVSPSSVVSEGQEVEVMILEIDPGKRRVSLGLKQCTPNSLEEFAKDHPVESEITVEIKRITEFGLIVKVTDSIEGTVHKDSLSWTTPGDVCLAKYSVGDKIKVKITAIDPQKEILGLGIKQLASDEQKSKLESIKKGDNVVCRINKVVDAGLEVTCFNGMIYGFIPKSDLSKEKRIEAFSIGEEIEGKITVVQQSNNKLILSVKEAEMEHMKKALDHEGYTTSGGAMSLKDAMEKAKGIDK